jgi:hypothetical protein
LFFNFQEFEIELTELRTNVSWKTQSQGADKNVKRVFNTIGFELALKRNRSPYFWTYFLPVTGMVIAASISFLIPPESIPGRVTLLITLSLVMSGMFNVVQVIAKVDCS